MGSHVSQAMLMAAGLGTRMRPFSDSFSKPHLPVMGLPVVVYALDQCAEAGVQRVVANIHALPEKTRTTWSELTKRYGRLNWPELKWSDETQLLLGSAGGVVKALPQFGGQSFFVINGDTLCDLNFAELSRRHQLLRNKWGVHLTLALHANAGRFAQPGKYREIFVDPAAERVVAAGDVVMGRPFLSGVYVAEAEAFAHLRSDEPSDFLKDVLLPAIAAGRVGAYQMDGPWYDAGSPELWQQTHLDLIRGLETGDCPSLWRKRIIENNIRVAQEVWWSREMHHASFGRGARIEWTGPAYADLRTPWNRALSQVGPNAVVYGDAHFGNDRLSERVDGVGYADHWVKVAST